MLYCKKCKISISGNFKYCPLCKGEVAGQPSDNIFPQLKKPVLSRYFSYRITSFICATFIIIFTAIYFLNNQAHWALISIAGIGCLWVNITTGILYKDNVLKNITSQYYTIMCIMLIIDFFTGFEKWSIIWVLPNFFMGLIISTLISGIVLKLPFDEYVIYLLCDTILGFTQIILVVLNVNNFIYPAIICILFLLICDLFILIFGSKYIKKAIVRLFHI